MINNILLIANDTRWKGILRNLLTKGSYALYEIDSYLTGKQLLERHNFALIISATSSGANSIEGIKALAGHVPQTQTIFISDHETLEQIRRERPTDFAMTLYDKRQFDPGQFQALVTKILGQITDQNQSEEDKTQILQPLVETTGRALVVENNERWQQIITRVLTERLAVTAVKDAPAALGELLRRKYELVTIDLNLASSTAAENRDGRHLLKVANDLGIPAIIISGKLQPEEVIADYQQYEVWSILDKAGFETKHFRSLIDDILKHSKRSTPVPIDDDLMYKVVQTLFRNLFKTNHEIANKHPIQRLSRLLDQPTNGFLGQLREALDSCYRELLDEAEREEVSHHNLDQRMYPSIGDFTFELIESMKSNQNSKNKQVRIIKSERLKRILVLEVLYRYSHTLKPQLLKELSVSEAALNRLRKKGIVEIVSRLYKFWP